jgi:hypothetical protein
MAHDVEAAWASAELAYMFGVDPSHCFASVPKGAVTAFAGREGKALWPHADGVVTVDHSSFGKAGRRIAVEFKRANEGIHGVLTAIGQAHAYLHKGYSGSAIVIPGDYETLTAAGDYVSGVLRSCGSSKRIGVFGYKPPNAISATPFRDRIARVRPMEVDSINPSLEAVRHSKSETQWAHVREGSTTPDAFYRFLQTIKLVSAKVRLTDANLLPKQLLAAGAAGGRSPEKFLSNSVGDDARDVAWREFWFRYVLTPEVAVPWRRVRNLYEVQGDPTGIRRADGNGMSVFFAGRSDSPKNKLVSSLNAGTIGESDAWKQFAQKIHARAHSFREDIDSGLEHLGFLDASGHISDSGYRFIDACERTDNPNGGLARRLFGAALLRHGQFAALLHYIHFVSEDAFKKDPYRFVVKARFCQQDYLEHLEEQLSDKLRVMRTVSKRGGVARKPLQAELSVLRQLQLARDFRVGVGLVINWPAVQEFLDVASE